MHAYWPCTLYTLYVLLSIHVYIAILLYSCIPIMKMLNIILRMHYYSCIQCSSGIWKGFCWPDNQSLWFAIKRENWRRWVFIQLYRWNYVKGIPKLEYRHVQVLCSSKFAKRACTILYIILCRSSSNSCSLLEAISEKLVA